MRLSIPSISLTTVVALFYFSASCPSTEALPAPYLNKRSLPVSYAHHSVVRVNIQSEEQLKTLVDNEYSFHPDYFTHERNIGAYVDMRIAPENMPKFQALSLKYEVLTNDLQSFLDQEQERDQLYQQQWDRVKMNKASSNGVTMDAFASAADWFQGYHNFKDSQDWLNAQILNHASIASGFSAGKSVESRNLAGIKIGSGSKKIVIIGKSRRHVP